MVSNYLKNIFIVGFLLVGFFVLSLSYSQPDKCGIAVVKSYNQQVMGKNVGFYVVFKNNSKRSMDAIDYEVNYKNGFNESMGKRSFTWQAGNFFGPKLPGESLSDGSTTWVEGANKINVVIKRVHFTDGYTCK